MLFVDMNNPRTLCYAKQPFPGIRPDDDQDSLGLPALDALLSDLGLTFRLHWRPEDGNATAWIDNGLVDTDMFQEAAADIDSDKLKAVAADLLELARRLQPLPQGDTDGRAT